MPAPTPPPRPPTILVVDDEPAIRQLVATVLGEDGFRVAEAADGAEALQTLAQEPIDAVISDGQMPRVDGPTLIRTLRRRGSPIPVVLMSARGVTSDQPQVLVLPKPFRLERVRQLVRAALTRRPSGASPAGRVPTTP